MLKLEMGSMLRKVQEGSTCELDECLLVTSQGIRRPVATINGQCMPAPRAVWTLAQGDPGEAWVLHTCHRGDMGCINIRHLYLGDCQQNKVDEMAAERHARGERNGESKLSPDAVAQIRSRYRPGLGYALAREFGIGRSQVGRIVSGEAWKHLG